MTEDQIHAILTASWLEWRRSHGDEPNELESTVVSRLHCAQAQAIAEAFAVEGKAGVP